MLLDVVFLLAWNASAPVVDRYPHLPPLTALRCFPDRETTQEQLRRALNLVQWCEKVRHVHSQPRWVDAVRVWASDSQRYWQLLSDAHDPQYGGYGDYWNGTEEERLERIQVLRRERLLELKKWLGDGFWWGWHPPICWTGRTDSESATAYYQRPVW